MLIRIGCELIFAVPAPAPMLLMLYAHPSRATTLRHPDAVVVEPFVPVDSFLDWFGNRAARIVAPAGPLCIRADNVAEDSGVPEPSIEGLALHPVEALPAECWRYLLPSRYCEVDRMIDVAWGLFGKTPPTWERAQAIVDWVHQRVEFGYEYARATKTAVEVYAERQGVCRDFQHLAITFLRAMNVPARYATGYLGDIGVPPSPVPMDFSAWLEVYLGGRWIALDARHNQQRIGRVLMALGRDAADVALTTSFGATSLERFTVWTDEVASDALAPRPAGGSA